MKAWILIVSIGALVSTGGAFLASPESTPEYFLLLGLLLTSTAGALSAINAGRLEHPIWRALWILATALGIVSVCSGFLVEQAYFSLATLNDAGKPSAVLLVASILMVTPTGVLPLLAVLCALLLRLRTPKPAVPSVPEPPVGTS
jgi:hypothetical protein